MKRVFYTSMGILLYFMWISAAVAEQNNTTSVPEQDAQTKTVIQGEQIIPPVAGVSWKERVWMQREIKKRAAASRNTLLREAADNNQNKNQIPLEVESPMQVESQNKP